jgi:hypothetical protein
VSWKKALWRLVMVGLFAFAGWKIYISLGSSLSQLSWESIAVWSPAPLPLVISVIIAMAVNILHAALWRRISVDLGSPAPNARATMHIYFVSGLSRYVVKLGQMAGLAVLAARFGMAAGRATAAALLGQLLFLISGFLFVSATMPGVRKQLPALPIDPAILGLILATITIGGTWFIVATRMGHRIREQLLARASGRTGERLSSAFAMVDEARPRDALVWMLGYALSMGVLAIGFVYFTTAFYPGAAQHARFVAGTAAATLVLGNISPGPAGVGREFVTILLLKTIMPAPVAFIIGILSRPWFMSGELLPLFLIPMLQKPAIMSKKNPAVIL